MTIAPQMLTDRLPSHLLRELTSDQFDLVAYVMGRMINEAMRSAGEAVSAVDREDRDAHIVDINCQRVATWARYVPRIFVGARVENLDRDRQHRDTIESFLDGAGRTLFLAGEVGTGKSYAAWALAHLASARLPRQAVHAWSLPRLLLDMKPDGDRQAFSRACTADLLILDDIAAAKPTDWSVEQIYSIAEARSSSDLRTIVTTNASYDALCQMWGEPTMDRLKHKSITAVFTGESRRERLW